jgi:hypothetical protein
MGLIEGLVIFVVGYVSGRVTRWFASIAAVVTLLLGVLGLAAPQSFFVIADPVLSFYAGNELLFLSGFLFAIAHHQYADG